MHITGGCYCGELRYEYNGEALVRAQCHCRECQYISGGGPNILMGISETGFSYTSGTPSSFTRSDIEAPATREFCGNCGTHILTRSPRIPGGLILKVGTMDDPAEYGQPEAAVWASEKQSFHCIPDDLPTFEKLPG